MRQSPVYGSLFFPACRELPEDGHFESRKDPHWVCVNTEGIGLILESKKKLIFFETYDNLAWLCAQDTITLEQYSPVDVVNNSPDISADTRPENALLSVRPVSAATAEPIAYLPIVTPQSHLIDSLAVAATRRIEWRNQDLVAKIRQGTKMD